MVAAHYLYARTITAMYHSEEEALEAEARYRTVAGGQLPETMVTLDLPSEPIGLIALLRAADLAVSNSEARRLVTSGAIRIDLEQVRDLELTLPGQGEVVLSRGKNRFVKVSFGK